MAPISIFKLLRSDELTAEQKRELKVKLKKRQRDLISALTEVERGLKALEKAVFPGAKRKRRRRPRRRWGRSAPCRLRSESRRINPRRLTTDSGRRQIQKKARPTAARTLPRSIFLRWLIVRCRSMSARGKKGYGRPEAWGLPAGITLSCPTC